MFDDILLTYNRESGISREIMYDENHAYFLKRFCIFKSINYILLCMIMAIIVGKTGIYLN